MVGTHLLEPVGYIPTVCIVPSFLPTPVPPYMTVALQGKEIAACDLGLAQPTASHMALYMLYRHARSISGIPVNYLTAHSNIKKWV